MARKIKSARRGRMAEFLLELFSEEIPARMQAKAAEELRQSFEGALTDVDYDKSKTCVYVTPRRLVLLVPDLPLATAAREEERKGPKIGSPDAAIQGFLKSAGLANIDQAEIRKTDKGDFYFAVIKKPAESMQIKLSHAITTMLQQFRWEKSMRWKGSFSWVRPLRGITAVFDGKPFSGTVQIGGMNNHDDQTTLKFADATAGHRFMGSAKAITVKDFADYKKQLHTANVILDREERKKIILAELEEKAKSLGLTLRPDEGLLEEVAGLVEWPVVLTGTIDAEFLSVPDRILITSMRQHQKYFSLLNKDGSLSNKFAVVANIAASDGGKTIVAGNERVLRARLSDAKFFWEQDKKIPLEQRLPKLKDIVFHAKLGSLGARVERLCLLAQAIAAKTGADPRKAFDAASLCKADLVSGMVGEFPELQGYMGGQYALAQGEDKDVAHAIEDHYKPAGQGDSVPKEKLSIVLALAEKIDTLTGFFAADEKPTGSKDPYALRRACLGVIRIVLENNINLALGDILRAAYQAYAAQLSEMEQDEGKTVKDLMDFFKDRLRVYLRDQGLRHDAVTAALAVAQEDDMMRLSARARTLQEFLSQKEGADLLAAYNRASNIVRIEAGKDKKDFGKNVDTRLLQQEAEIQLHAALAKMQEAVSAAMEKGDFPGAMRQLSALRQPLDAFFENIMVNTDDADLRANRLRLLNHLRANMDLIADFTKIEA